MTQEEKELIVECLKDYELAGKVSMKAVNKILDELVGAETTVVITAKAYEEGYIDGANDLRKEVIKYMQHLKTVHPDDVAMQRVDQEELNNCYRYLLVERYVNGGKDEENNT